MLLRIYSLHQISKELAKIANDLNMPIAYLMVEISLFVVGTRWTKEQHFSVLYCYNIYVASIPQLKQLIEIIQKEYILKWKTPYLLIGSALYLEILKPSSILSLALQ